MTDRKLQKQQLTEKKCKKETGGEGEQEGRGNKKQTCCSILSGMLLSETCPGIPAMNKALCCNRRKKNRTRSCQHDSEENSFLSEKSNHYCNLKAHAQHATWPSVFVFYPSLLQQSIPEHLLPWATNRHQVSGPHMICIISSHLSKTQHKPWVVTSPN